MIDNDISLIEVKNIIEKIYLEASNHNIVDKKKFRAKYDNDIELLDKLEGSSIIWRQNYEKGEYYELHVWSLYLLNDKNENVKLFFKKSEKIFEYIKQFYKEFQDEDIEVDAIIKNTNEDLFLIRTFIKYFDFFFSSRPTDLFLNDSFILKISEQVLLHKSYNDLLADINRDSLNKLNRKSTSFYQSVEYIDNNRQKKKVFIVHGHDDLLKNEVSIFLKNLGLVPVILHEQANKGKTIIEKLEYYTDVDYAIILYTPCDVGGKKDEDQNFRARQNVVFEHGFLMSKLGRNNISVIKKGNVELPNDITGTVYVDGKSNWQSNLVKELKSAKFDIDVNKIFQEDK